MKVSQRLYNCAQKIWDMYYSHPFINGLKDGSLDIAKFRRFMLEDYLYLFEYVKVFAIGLTKTKDFELMKMLSQSIDSILSHEMDIHRSYMKKIGISDEDVKAFSPSLDNISYTSYMLSVAQSGDVSDVISSVLACSWSYAKIGLFLADDESAKNHEFYGQWISGYASKEYQDANDLLINLIDDITKGISDEKYAQLEEIFVNCSLYEKYFWDMAWGED